MPASSLNTWSLWLEPDKTTQPIFSRIITDLSSVSPGSPAFRPHATLCGAVDISNDLPSIRNRLEQIITDIRQAGPLTLTCQPPTTGELYFQCILSPVSPSPELLALRNACADAWNETRPYFPHISLKYGDVSPVRREEIAEMARKVSLPKEVIVKGISIVRCVGTADEWEVVDFVPFR